MLTKHGIEVQDGEIWYCRIYRPRYNQTDVQRRTDGMYLVTVELPPQVCFEVLRASVDPGYEYSDGDRDEPSVTWYSFGSDISVSDEPETSENVQPIYRIDLNKAEEASETAAWPEWWEPVR